MDHVRPEAGAVVGGRYRLVHRLGRGAIGEVWLAEHQTLGSHVALKFLRGRARRDPWFLERFLDEARIAARLPSRHVARVFDVATTDDRRPYVVMEYLDGETLEVRLRREGKLAPAFAARVLLQVAKGLAKAHAAGIVHRDVKPQNIFLCTDEDGCVEAKVLDFGVAKMLGGLEEPGSSERSIDLRRTSGRLVGTPTHMAPEQTRGDGVVGSAADVWAFGVVAYECLFGELPFVGADAAELFARIRSTRRSPGPAARALLAAYGLESWFATVFAVDPAQRFANVRTCADSLACALRAAASAGAPVVTAQSSKAPREIRRGISARGGRGGTGRVIVASALALAVALHVPLPAGPPPLSPSPRALGEGAFEVATQEAPSGLDLDGPADQAPRAASPAAAAEPSRAPDPRDVGVAGTAAPSEQNVGTSEAARSTPRSDAPATTLPTASVLGPYRGMPY